MVESAPTSNLHDAWKESEWTWHPIIWAIIGQLTLHLPTRAEQKTSDLYSLSLSFNEVYWDVASMTGCPKNVAVEPQKVGYF